MELVRGEPEQRSCPSLAPLYVICRIFNSLLLYPVIRLGVKPAGIEHRSAAGVSCTDNQVL